MTSQSLAQDTRIIGLVALAHGLSHFYQIVTAVLFPLIKDDLGVSYAALGATTAAYYVVSGVFQTLAGFAVDRFGARRVLFGGLALAVGGALLAGFARSYEVLFAAALVGGIGNSVFHPCDFSILNARVTTSRLGYAFSWHGIAGFLGYAAAPAFGIGLAAAFGWRGALLAAAAMGVLIVLLLVMQGASLYVEPADARRVSARAGLAGDLRVLSSTPVLMCFGYFVLLAVGFIAIQNFGIATMIALYGVNVGLASAALTAYLLGAAAGIFTGGFIAVRFRRHCKRVAPRGGAPRAFRSDGVRRRCDESVARSDRAREHAIRCDRQGLRLCLFGSRRRFDGNSGVLRLAAGSGAAVGGLLLGGRCVGAHDLHGSEPAAPQAGGGSPAPVASV
jgi:FSR family fosmidomycin resistance protein-like MFS transporter